MDIKKILVPYDGEQMSDKAVAYATELAKALGSQIFLLYVIHEIEVPATLLLGNDRVLIARARRSIAKSIELRWSKFADEKTGLISKQRIQVSSHISNGDPAEEIVKFARENQVDLIIMGSRRLEGASRLVVALGSVARKVSERASCPVMLVH